MRLIHVSRFESLKPYCVANAFLRALIIAEKLEWFSSGFFRGSSGSPGSPALWRLLSARVPASFWCT